MWTSWLIVADALLEFEPELELEVVVGFAKDAVTLDGGVIPILRIRSRRACMTAT